MSKYFETKDGSLEAVSTKIAKEQPTIKKEEPNVKLERKTYFENKPGSLEDLASKVVSEGLDPVNKDAVKKKFDDRKDKDIDNDGDVDSSDKFLHKRRKAISKAMKEEKFEVTGEVDYFDANAPKDFEVTVSAKDAAEAREKVMDRYEKSKRRVSSVGISSVQKVNEELGKEDEPKVKKVVDMLKKASAAHAAQSKTLDKAVKEAVRPDDKGEIINKKKHDAYGDPKKGEVKPVDPEPKIAQIIKGEKETTRANGHMTKKKFSEMRIKLGKNGKTETGQDAAAVETEPKAERI